MNEVRTYEGGCHCNRVRFRVNADLASVIICNCSICTKKGIIHLIVPPERFELLSGQDDLTNYTFNTGVAKHPQSGHLLKEKDCLAPVSPKFALALFCHEFSKRTSIDNEKSISGVRNRPGPRPA